MFPKPISIVIPMAGKGSRFRDAGWDVPKPLIEVAGVPMYARAVSSLPIELCSQLIFLCLEEHLSGGGLERDIRERYSSIPCEIVSVEEVTRGQSETVCLARNLIPANHALLIYNADTYFRSNLRNLLMTLPEDVAGVLSVFEAEGEHWSFAKIESNGFITDVREKERISQWATTGMYFFSESDVFFELAASSIARNERINNEFYVAPLYNILLQQGAKLLPDYAVEVRCMGTPRELEETLAAGNFEGGAVGR